MVRNCIPPKMETTFYEDQSFQHRLNGDVNQLKRSMTLDLNASRGPAKRPKFNAAVTAAPVLSSPDLNMLKLGSPELEKLIIAQQNGLVTTTPTPTTQILFPRTVTEEQEMYARGFVDALNELHTSDSSQMSSAGGLQPVDVPVTSSSNGTGVGITYTTLEPHGQVVISQANSFPPITSAGYGLLSSTDQAILVKDEPQTVPSLGSTPPLSPINMECQEKIKLERKRQRNRIAASKCRRRKLERISRLEDKVKLLKGENTELGTVVHKLKEQVCQLKEQVMDHVHSGCQIMVAAHF
ncbi:Transcription factor AP-1 [Cryptotermes secundus]|uniref:Transcription factor AP-1 n=1 Tax=Cryptotermes secundus TaxID=105785 RepID=A0A2J7QWY3_9NEOP|nr:transcription factor AP-1 [Cryptotermes secundus]PNF33089.1 Transcription factor AP-1 [Cryptotermes secundus]